jgi:hypothetical protein
VAELVAAVTETKTEASSDPVRPWRVRKEEQLAHLAQATREVAALKAADALHNCHSTLRDLDESGPVAWQRFNAPARDQAWYYRSIAEHVGERLGDHALARELREAAFELASRVPASNG